MQYVTASFFVSAGKGLVLLAEAWSMRDRA